MKMALAASALTLILTGCSDDAGEGNLSAAAASQNTPLAQIPAPSGDWSQTVTETEEGGYRMGNPDAPVKLVEYASITCPHCADFTAAAADPLTNQYVKSGQVSWEYRPFMLFPTDPGIFMLLRCQGAGPFFTLTEQLYATQREWGGRLQSLTPDQAQLLERLPPNARSGAIVQAAGLDQFFRQRGMPEARMNSCLADPKGLERLAEITKRGAEVDGVQGTPTFFINGEKVEASDWASLEPRIRAAIGG